MPKPEATNAPGPGRSTQEAAFTDITRDIAAKNAKAHDAARRVRDADRSKRAAKKRLQDGY